VPATGPEPGLDHRGIASEDQGQVDEGKVRKPGQTWTVEQWLNHWLNTIVATIALALGLRQGEALELRWSDIDEIARALTVRRNRLRPKWKHGCATPRGHKHGGHCPQRIPLREDTGPTKSKAGNRIIGLPDELVTLLQRHHTEQDRERATAAELWHDTGYMFTTPTGQPLNLRTDHHEWKQLIARAGVAERRLHDAPHTAATVLLLLGVAGRTVMGVMGWSNTAMAARYQHITATIRHDVAQRVGGLLWEPTRGPSPEPSDGDPAACTAAQMQPEMQPLPRTEPHRRSSRPALTLVKGGGSGGIRTPGPSRVARFQGRRPTDQQ
jgi:hypothetical protein